jgi:excisionase family DNA binding protein
MDLLTLAQAAELTGIDPSTMRRHIAEGKLKATKPGHDWLVTRADLEEYKKLGIKPRKAHTRRRRKATESAE